MNVTQTMYSFLPIGKPKSSSVQLFGDNDDVPTAAPGPSTPMSAKERRKAEKAATLAASAKKKSKSATSSTSKKMAKSTDLGETVPVDEETKDSTDVGDADQVSRTDMSIEPPDLGGLDQITAMSQVSRFHEDTLETDPRDVC